MSEQSTTRIDFDAAAFDPMKVMPVRHHLMDHPLLQLDKLVALGRRLAASNSVRWHSAEATQDSSFHHAPDTHKAKWSAEETLARIEDASAWCSLLNVQQDSEYRALIDEILDGVRPIVERKDPGMCFRAGWIFISSPNAITPYHLDHEHNFILQVRGGKTLRVWDPLDRNIVSEEALELFHGASSRDKITWSQDIEERAYKFDLEPGMGGYMPTNAPHWVKNGPGVSITLSATYYTQATNRRKLQYRCNYMLRRRGLSPSPVGISPIVDSTKLAVFNVVRGLNHSLQKLRGRAPENLTLRYAPVP
ncbi:MAG: transcription factor [Vicinamibacterales bacterium]